MKRIHGFYSILKDLHKKKKSSFSMQSCVLLRLKTRILGVVPFSFSNRNLGSFCAWGTETLYTHSLWEVVDHSESKMHNTCLIIMHDLSMRTGLEANWEPKD